MSEPIKRSLMVAFQYPPFHGSSGIQRTLKFVQYLPEHGWQSIVLSAWRAAYEEVSDEQMGEIDPSTPVYRAWALDAARHLAIKGKYFGWFDRPDRWRSWALTAVFVGRLILRRHRPKVIWSTYPITTAHTIAYRLQKISGLPWVADFRDNMVDEDFPTPGGRKRGLYQKLEAQWIRAATRVVVTTESARDMYAQRYPNEPSEKWVVIRNGYDENNFVQIESRIAKEPQVPQTKMVFVHSGLLHPDERNPAPFFEAIARLKRSGGISGSKLKVILRGSGHDAAYQPKIDALGIGDIVELASQSGYYTALAEMLKSDGLLLFQGTTCNHLVPAKLYEYLRCGRPIFALTDARGETAQVMRTCGLSTIVDMDSADAIAPALEKFVASVAERRAEIAQASMSVRYSRRAQVGELAQLFDSLT